MKHFTRTLFFFLLFGLSAFTLSAQRTVTGRITDAETGEPLIGATVGVLGAAGAGTVTDANGNFRLNVPPGSTTLRISYTGFDTQEIALTDQTTVDVAMQGTSVLLSDDVVVIGSRSATRTKLETAVPVDVIPISAVTSEIGQVDLNQILTYIAPSFQSARQAIADGTDHVDPAQLRGLGPDQVLVLINGKRRHQSALVNVNGTVNRGTVGTDLAAIPVTAIERIEILRDGASAQYGSDAIAGVINIVLKNRTGVLDGSVSYGQHVTEYEKHYALAQVVPGTDANERVSDGETVQAGLNYGVRLGARGVLSLTGEYISRGATNRGGTYTGQIYPRNGANMIVDDSILAARGLDREAFDMRIGQSKVTGGGLMFNLDLGLNDAWTFYSFGGLNIKQGNAAGFYRYPNSVVGGARSFADEVLALYPNGFLPEINSDVRDLSGALGLRGRWNGWNVDLSNTTGQNRFDFSVANSVNYSQVQVAPTNFQTTFDAGGLSFLQNTSNLDVSRKYAEVLSGLNVALGAEYRVDQFGITAGEEASYLNYDTTNTPQAAGAAQVFPGFLPANEGTNNRNSVGLYLDLEQDFTEAFMLGAAVRFENYSDFGSTVNYKAVGRYKFGNMLSLRASASTGFRAPSMQQRFYSKTNTLFVNSPAGLVPVESGTFTNNSVPARILGIPELTEETSISYSAGLTARPFTGLELTVDVYQINIDDRIVLTNNFTGGTDTALQAQLLAANAAAANFFANAVDTRARGLETVLSYGRRFAGRHDLRLVLAGTFIHNEVRKTDGFDTFSEEASGAPVINASEKLIASGQIGNYFNREDQSRIEVANPKAKISTTLNYKVGHFGLMLRNVWFDQVKYLDPTINPAMPDAYPVNSFTGAKETLDQTFAAKSIWDVSVSYRLVKGLRLTVGVNNLFDTYQDRHQHSNNVSLGRFVYSRRVQQFGFNGRYVFGRLKFDF